MSAVKVILIIALVALTLCSGCASLSWKSAGCDFAQGSYNATAAYQNQQQLYRNFDPNRMPQEDESTIIGAGFISMIIGTGKRLILGANDSNSCGVN
ncbi:hypothetical protein [Paraferrimonas sp. SM1919]|uniref:hypothetical protein n=1 Tax=Paraferrimonas sp. SM1919 TaxID=2662263 RepID=UPI0013D729DA|nr:hypothetical protein [Paraferrimonas sp. SM1919]